ncbi:MAG: type II toxin-antitoxin system death-on-curing family toxin [Terracidiphilus sp.]
MTGHEWNWVPENVVLAIHEAMLAEHGGLRGIRDQSLLLSALARPQNLAAYGDPDVADLAAAYAAGITRNHAFIDGNKRTSLGVALVFLLDNQYELIAANDDLVMTMLSVADGTMSEPELAIWLRTYIRPRKTE